MSLPPNPHPVDVFQCALKRLVIAFVQVKLPGKLKGGYLEKPVSLAFRGTLRDVVY